jgi:hypothetical protein
MADTFIALVANIHEKSEEIKGSIEGIKDVFNMTYGDIRDLAEHVEMVGKEIVKEAEVLLKLNEEFKAPKKGEE